MNEFLQTALMYAGALCAVGFAGMGSALGTGAAGQGAVGAWKRSYMQNKPASFQLTVFAGAPLSQTIYGMIIMFVILKGNLQFYPTYLAIGIVGGIAIGLSAWLQGKAAAGACDAFGETGKGFVNYLLALGIIETVAIFIMAFSLILISKIPQA